jgi:hypothetical protein
MIRLDLFDNRGRRRAVHVDPRLFRDIEDGRKAAHALPGMDTNASAFITPIPEENYS